MQDNLHKKRVHEFFNSDNAYLTGNMITELRKQLIFQMLGKVKNKNIIDIGCGNGSVSIPFLSTNNLTFLDFSINMLKEVGKKVPSELKENYEIFHGDIESFQPAIKFDIVLVLGLLAHVENLNAAIKKISEMLKPEGICIVQITDGRTNIAKVSKMFSIIKGFVRKKNIKYKINKLNSDDIMSSFRQNDLHLIEKVTYFSTIPGFRLIPVKFRKDFLFYLNKKEMISKIGSEIIFKFIKN